MSLIEAQSGIDVGATPAASITDDPAIAGGWRDYIEMTKPRLNALVLVTTAVGFVVGERMIDVASMILLGHVLIGTALCAASGAVLNQWMEIDSDAQMQRTRSRPLPAGRMTPRTALYLGMILGLLGLGHLAFWVPRWEPTALALLTLVTYVLVYTPLKSRTSLCTIVGAIPGALPPLIGWTAATGRFNLPGLSLFLILFVWQMPHFLAIAWIYRDDYKAAGFPMLPVIDTEGRLTAAAIFTWSFVMLPVTLLPGIVRGTPGEPAMFGLLYLLAALVLGVIQIGFAINLVRRPSVGTARALFFCTIMYLPALLGVMVVDAVVLPTLFASMS